MFSRLTKGGKLSPIFFSGLRRRVTLGIFSRKRGVTLGSFSRTRGPIFFQGAEGGSSRHFFTGKGGD